MWSIIGGSGFEDFEGFETIEQLDRQTPFGEVSSGFRKVHIAGEEALFISRHGAHHELQPSEVNYRANIFALKRAGASKVMSVSAVGSLRKEFKPGDLVVPDQYIDRTKSLRKHTFCGDGIVGHVSLAHPTTEALSEVVAGISADFDFDVHIGGTYICIEGPYFSTIAESKSYNAMGADIIGMTNFPEYALAREAGLCYLPLSFVTDYDCWDQSIPHVTLDQVIALMKKNNAKAFKLASRLVEKEAHSLLPNGCADLGLKSGLMTPVDRVPDDKKEWLRILME